MPQGHARLVEPFDLWLFGCMIPALWKGGAPERVAAAGIVVAALATKISVETTRTAYRTASPAVIFVDVMMAVFLVVLTLRANRFWPMVIAALQTCVVVAHVAKLANPELDPLAYYLILTKWSYVIALVPAIGAVRHQARLSKCRVDEPWHRSALNLAQ